MAATYRGTSADQRASAVFGLLIMLGIRSHIRSAQLYDSSAFDLCQPPPPTRFETRLTLLITGHLDLK